MIPNRGYDAIRFASVSGRLRAVLGCTALLTLVLWVAGCGPSAVRPEGPPAVEPALVETPAVEPVEAAPAAPAVVDPTAESRAEDEQDEEALAAEMPPYDRARILMLEQSMVRFRERADETYGLLQEALAADPNNGEIVFNLGVYYTRMGRYDEATNAFRRAITLAPELSVAHAQLGVLLLRRGDRQAGEAAVARARQLSPQDPVVHVTLAAQEIDRGNYDSAIAHARTALLSDSDDMNAYLALGIAYFRLEQNDLGILVLGNGLELNPHAAPLHNLLGLFRLRGEDVRGAIASFQRAVTEDPELVDAHMNLGAATLANGDYATARRHFDIVLQAQSNNLDALLSRGVALRGLEQHDAAEQDYQDVLRRDPNMHGARYNLCILYQHHMEDYERAYTACNDYLERLDRRDRRYREMQRRVDGLRDTIKILREMPSS